MNKFLAAFLLLVWTGATGVTVYGQVSVVFSNSFNGSLPSEIQPGAAALTGVQGFAGLGAQGNQFGGSFLRSPTGAKVTLTLSNLPPHRTLSISMLFAAIDSLDGTGNFPAGDFFTLTVDTNIVFRESFANATPNQIQSYVAPSGAGLARHADLGFSGPGGYYTDSAYDFGADARFKGLTHTGAVATLSFEVEGPGIQSLDDESWAMDNLVVVIENLPEPVIQSIAPAGTNTLITWSTVSNAVYGLQTKTNLADAIWTDLPPLITATNSTATKQTPQTSTNGFYRVRLLIP